MSKQNNPKFEAKKAAVLKHQDRKMNPITIVIGVLVLLGAAGIGYYITANASSTSQMQAVTADTGGSSVSSHSLHLRSG